MIPSPCIGVCSTHAGEPTCSGCLRTAEEVQNWDELTDAAKRDCWARVKAIPDSERNARHTARINRFAL